MGTDSVPGEWGGTPCCQVDVAVAGEVGKCLAPLCQWLLLGCHPHLGASVLPRSSRSEALDLSSCHFALGLLNKSGWLLENHNRCCLAWSGSWNVHFRVQLPLLSNVSLTFIICCRLIQFPCRSGRGFPTGCARPFFSLSQNIFTQITYISLC